MYKKKYLPRNNFYADPLVPIKGNKIENKDQVENS